MTRIETIRRTGNVVMVWDECGSPNYDLSLVEPNAEGAASSGNAWSRYVNGAPAGSSILDTRPFPVIGDLVSIDTTTGRALRYNLLAEASRLPFGVVAGLAFNPLVYPAFGGDLTNRLAIATVGVGSELLVYRITGAGDTTTGGVYVNPDDATAEGSGAVIRAGDPVRFIYHRNVGRWGVRKAITNETAQAVVLRVSDLTGHRFQAVDGATTYAEFREPQKGLHIRLVQPFTVS